MNKVFLAGRITKDPDIRYTKDNKPVVRFTLAVDRGYGEKKSTDFISCAAFDMKADYIGKKWKKGDFMVVEGSIKTGSYDGKNGKVYTTDIYVDQIGNFPPNRESDAQKPTFTDIDESDGDLPF